MNVQKYAGIYGSFHGSRYVDSNQDMYVVPLTDLLCTKDNLLKLETFDKIYSPVEKPLTQALKAHYKSESICSVFSNRKNAMILMGSERIVVPLSENVKCYLVATTLFVKNPADFERYLQGVGRSVYENVYTYRNSVIFLDEFDVPGPGLSYFEATESNSLYRICFVVQRVNELNVLEWKNRREVFHLPFKTKFVTSLPKFIHYNPVDEIQLPESNATRTGTINKRLCFENPKFLLQDILDSYRGTIDHLGLIVQYPFCIGYDGACPPKDQFVTLVVNGNQPKKVIQVRSPYERYIEYDYVPPRSWVKIYYESLPSSEMERVVIESTVIGYVYRDFFLCLDHPLLTDSPSSYPLVNSTYLCRTASPTIDLAEDPDVTILDRYQYDCEHVLYRLRHKDLPYEVWCLASHEESRTFPKRCNPPHLVDHWLTFFSRNCKKSEFGDTNLDVVKLALILSKHKICYKIKISNAKSRQLETDGEGLVFKMDDKAVEFLNEVRLDLESIKHKTTEQSKCWIS